MSNYRREVVVDFDSVSESSESAIAEDILYEDFDMDKIARRIQSRIDSTTASLVRLTSPKNEDLPDAFDRILSQSNDTMQKRVEQRTTPDRLSDGKRSPMISPINRDNDAYNHSIFTINDKSPAIDPLRAEIPQQMPNLSNVAASPLTQFNALPKSPNSSVRRIVANQSTFDRMYHEAEAAKERREQLRIVTEMEREEFVRKSSFIENYRNSPTSSRRGRSNSPTVSINSMSSGGYRRTPRASSTPRTIEASQGGRLYYEQMQWMKDKDAQTEKLKKQLADDKKAMEDLNLTLKPRLQTSTGMQVQRSESNGEIFDVLYKSHQFYEHRREDLRQQLENEFYEKNRFIPEITPNSKRILNRKAQEQYEMDRFKSNISAEDDSKGYLFHDESMVPDGPTTPIVTRHGSEDATSSGGLKTTSSLHVMSTDRLYENRSPSARKNARKAELKKHNDRLSRSLELPTTKKVAITTEEAAVIVPTVVQVDAITPFSNESSAPLSAKTSNSGDWMDNITIAETVESDVPPPLTSTETPFDDAESNELLEHFNNAKQILAEESYPQKVDSSIHIIHNSPDAKPTPGSLKSSEWNPFDDKSKHYRSKSPPTLLKNLTPSDAVKKRTPHRYSYGTNKSNNNTPGSPSRSQYLPYSPNHMSTYRALRESGTLNVGTPTLTRSSSGISGVTTDIPEKGTGLFSVGSSAYNKLQERQHATARISTDGPFPSNVNVFGDANVTVVSGGGRSRNNSNTPNRTDSRTVTGLNGEEVPIEEYYARGRSRTRSRSPSVTRASSAGRKMTPNKRSSSAGGGSGFSTPNRNNGDNASRVTMNSGDNSLFERLYQARFESAQKLVENQLRHTPKYSFQPDIGKNAKHDIEVDKDAFFTRLYDQHKEKIVTEEALRTMHESDRQKELAASSSKGGRVLVMTAKEEAKTVERLMESKAKLESKVKQGQTAVEQSIQHLSHSRFIQTKSNTIANNAHSKALGEIFNVLCVTAQHREDQQKNPEQSVETNELQRSDTSEPVGESKENADPKPENNSKNVTMLDVAMAQPHMLQPKLLADTIAQVLQSLLEQHKSSALKKSKNDSTVDESQEEPVIPALLINKQQFVSEVLHQMKIGSLPPIGYILSQPERENKPVRQNNASKLMKSDDLAVLKCKPKPDLVAKRTDSLVKGRYKLRRLGQESIEDSLMSYLDFKEHKLCERKVEIEKEMKNVCTFAPQTNQKVPDYIIQRPSQYSQKIQKQNDANSRSNSVTRAKRSNSAPPRQHKNFSAPPPPPAADPEPEPVPEPTPAPSTGYIEDYFLINTAPTFLNKVKSHSDKIASGQHHQHSVVPHATNNAVNHSASIRNSAERSTTPTGVRSAPAQRVQQPRVSAPIQTNSYASTYDQLKERMRKDLYIDTTIATASSSNASVVSNNSSYYSNYTSNSGKPVVGTPKASYVYTGNNKTNNVLREATLVGASGAGKSSSYESLYKR